MRYNFSLTEFEGERYHYEYPARDFHQAWTLMINTLDILFPDWIFNGEAIEWDNREFALEGPKTMRGT